MFPALMLHFSGLESLFNLDVTAKAVNHRIQDLRTKAKEKFKTSGVAGNGSAAHTTDGPATALTKNVKSTPKKGKQAVTGTSKKGKRKAEAVEDEDQLDDEPALKKAAIFKEEDEHDDY